MTDQKRWREVCRSLGHDLSGQTSASFAMRQNYERCLLDYEAHLFDEEQRASKAETTGTNETGASDKKRENEASPADAGASKRPKRKRDVVVFRWFVNRRRAESEDRRKDAGGARRTCTRGL